MEDIRECCGKQMSILRGIPSLKK